MNRLRVLWQHLNASLWFVPTLMVAGATILAFGLVLAEPLLRQRSGRHDSTS